MKTAKTILFLVFLCGITTIASAQIKVDDTASKIDLVNKLIGTSTCITMSGTPTVSGDPATTHNSYGTFDKDTSNFPLNSGIVLSTWSAKNSEGPFTIANSVGGTLEWPGDADLNQVLGITSKNATSLEFDIKPSTNFISFKYLFASNEYQKEYPCNYSDGFAFLIRESTATTYTNLAVIPETSTPVSSLNIHPEINSSGTIEGTIYKCSAVYKDFFNGFNTSTSPINYAGQTIVMTAQAKVTPGVTYKIKLVVADNREKYFNSAVFLEAGSFSPKIDLGANQLKATNNPVCFGDTYSIKMDDILPGVNIFNYEWYEDGVPILTQTGSILSVTKDGTYKVKVDLGGGCSATGEIKIEFAPEIILNPTTLNKCDDNGNGTATFDLTKAKTDLLDGNTATTTIDYFKTITLSDLILDPSSFKYNLSTSNIVYVNLTIYGTCSAVAEITLQTLPSTVISGICPDPIINAFSGNKNSVELIPPTTGGFYEYSLDGTNYKTSPLFSDLTAGEYTAYIRNSSTCEYLINPFIILDYPRFFTPNNDGYNDTWKIKNLESFPKAILTIFDRYGKLLSQINTINSEWNGKFNGYDLPADDYWFALNFGVGKITKGHFSLKR